MKNFNNKKNKKGFTLIEIMVAVSIFVIVAFIVTSTLLAILDASRRANKIRLIVDNMNFALDSMSIKMKFGKIDTLTSESVSFYDREGDYICYKLIPENTAITPKTNGSIQKCLDGCAGTCRQITTSEISVTGLTFKEPISCNDEVCLNKEIIILVNATVKMKDQSDMSLDFQTAVSQVTSVGN